jgi:phosphomannomutase/phosphoglucomutase
VPGGHAQTVYAALVARPRRRVAMQRERWDTPDGDFVDVDWLDGPPGAPLLVMFHGLEGSASSHYARALMLALRDAGWRGAIPHFRSCSGELNRLPRAYHSGDSAEVGWMLERFARESRGAPLFAVGISLGGNALLKWLGEHGEASRALVSGAVAVSAPVDLAAGADAIEQGFAMMYTRMFLRTLKRKVAAKARRHAGAVDPAGIERVRTLREFDDRYTAPLHGFRDAEDYYARSSAKGFLRHIRVPTLVINARNDPFLPGRHLPARDEVSACVTLETPEHGGHVGFVSGPFPGHVRWLPRRIMAFLEPYAAASSPPPTESPPMNVPHEIFKAYDIRGIVGKSLTPEVVTAVGRALGTLAREHAKGGAAAIAIGRDGRLSGPELSQALARGIQSAGADVVDVGMVTTPMGYFAAHSLGTGSAVVVTGSHNPPDYNGLKMVIGGTTLSGDAIQSIRTRVESGDLMSGQGAYREANVRDAYLERVSGDVKLARKMKIVVDAGNGVAGSIAPELYRRLGCEVIELFCDVDGTFPNHHPDPSQPKNLQDVIATLKTTDAEIGLAFDGDGDRLGVVTKDGKIIYPDRQLMLFAKDVLSRVPGGDIIFDVKCTRNLAPWIRSHGGTPQLWKTGHSLIKARMKELKAPLAGEMSGHVFFGERWFGFDDGVYAGARLLEILSRGKDPSAVLNALPDSVTTPELNVKLAEGEPHRLIAKMQQEAEFPGAENVIKLDGLRVEYADGFGLARASNTTPVIVLRFEAQDQQGLERIQAEFRRVLTAAKPGAELPF